MQKATYHAYLKLAEHFIASRFDDTPEVVGQMTDALLKCAPEYRPDYWRRLKTALALHTERRGHIEASKKIRALQNPTTTSGDSSQKKPKQRRVKSVSDNDHQKLLKYLRQKRDLPVIAAVLIVYLTGCRPAEIPKIKLFDGQRIYIPSAKKTDTGRGIDRVLTLKSDDYEIVERLLPHLEHDEPGHTPDISRIQRRLYRHVKNLWPARKSHLSLYSYRHQMGANLKSSGMPESERALIMGHSATDSIDAYGDRRRGNGLQRDINAAPSPDSADRTKSFKGSMST